MGNTAVSEKVNFDKAIRTACDIKGMSLAEASRAMKRKSPYFLSNILYAICKGEYIAYTSVKVIEEFFGPALKYIPHIPYDKVGKRVNLTRRKKSVQLELVRDQVVEGHKLNVADADDPLVLEVRHLRREQTKTNVLLQALVDALTTVPLANKEGL